MLFLRSLPETCARLFATHDPWYSLLKYSRSSNNIVLFGLMSKSNAAGLGPLSVRSLHILPLFVWVFSEDFSFLLYPKDVHVKWLACLNRSILSEPECRCECVLQWKSLLSGRVPALHPKLLGEAPDTHDPGLQ